MTTADERALKRWHLREFRAIKISRFGPYANSYHHQQWLLNDIKCLADLIPLPDRCFPEPRVWAWGSYMGTRWEQNWVWRTYQGWALDVDRRLALDWGDTL
jgi:hypothetical protein